MLETHTSINNESNYSSDQDRASIFVKNIIKDVIEKRQLQQSKLVTEQDSNQFLEHSKRYIEKENTQQNSSFNHYPAKSPNTVSQLFKKTNQNSQTSLRIPLNEIINRPPASPYQFYYQSPFIQHFCSEQNNFQSPDKLCNYCKQTMNISCERQEKSIIKKKNLGFFSYNFIFSVSSHESAEKKYKSDQSPKIKKPQKEEIYQSQNLKQIPLRTSAANMQSFDFDLSISQNHRNHQQEQLAKERQFSEVCVSQVIQQGQETSPNDLKFFKTMSTQRESRSPVKDIIKQPNVEMVKESIQQMSQTDRQTIIKFLQLEQRSESQKQIINRNLDELQKLMPPVEIKEVKLHTRASVNREFRSDPLELGVSKSIPNITYNNLNTPLSKLLDQLDVSDIYVQSQESSICNALQQNLIKEFERQSTRCPSQPQKLMKQVYQQIETLKQANTRKNSENKLPRVPSGSRVVQNKKTLKTQNSTPSLYQKVLKGGARKTII